MIRIRQLKKNYLGRAEKKIGDFANNSNGTYNSSWDNSFWAKRYPYLRDSLRPNNHLAMYADQLRFYDNLFNGNRKNFEKPSGYGNERGSRNILYQFVCESKCVKILPLSHHGPHTRLIIPIWQYWCVYGFVSKNRYRIKIAIERK